MYGGGQALKPRHGFDKNSVEIFSKLRSRLTYANAMSTIAVFIALGGGAYAVSRAAQQRGARSS